MFQSDFTQFPRIMIGYHIMIRYYCPRISRCETFSGQVHNFSNQSFENGSRTQKKNSLEWK